MYEFLCSLWSLPCLFAGIIVGCLLTYLSEKVFKWKRVKWSWNIGNNVVPLNFNWVCVAGLIVFFLAEMADPVNLLAAFFGAGIATEYSAIWFVKNRRKVDWRIAVGVYVVYLILPVLTYWSSIKVH